MNKGYEKPEMAEAESHGAYEEVTEAPQVLNELRYYVNMLLEAYDAGTSSFKTPDGGQFIPTYLVTAVKLPSGAIELATNTDGISDKLKYISEAYGNDMKLKTNPEVSMCNMMLV